MRAVVADTGPLNYLVLIDLVGVLPMLFGTVHLPETVRAELSHSEAPPQVRKWLVSKPPWVAFEPDAAERDADLQSLDDGERAAISLARALNADLLLMDDRKAVAAARRGGLPVIGTLGLLELAARRSLVDLQEAFGKLRATSFHCRATMLDEILARHQLRP